MEDILSYCDKTLKTNHDIASTEEVVEDAMELEEHVPIKNAIRSIQM